MINVTTTDLLLSPRCLHQKLVEAKVISVAAQKLLLNPRQKKKKKHQKLVTTKVISLAT